jgi:hypothetical protein
MRSLNVDRNLERETRGSSRIVVIVTRENVPRTSPLDALGTWHLHIIFEDLREENSEDVRLLHVSIVNCLTFFVAVAVLQG